MGSVSAPPGRSWSIGEVDAVVLSRALPRSLGRSVGLRVAQITLLAVCCWTTPCWAERVVIVRPKPGDAALGEMFNRLQGELRMLGFDTIIASSHEAPTFEELQRVAELGQAAATIAIERVDKEPTSHVWFMDHETSKARILSISLPETDETPTLLALRTVELLRSSVRERSSVPGRGQRESSAALPVEVEPHRAVPRTFDMRSDSEVSPALTLRLDAAWIWNSIEPAGLVGPALSAGYRVHPNWEFAVRLLVPLSNQTIATESARAKFRTDSVSAESRWKLRVAGDSLAIESLLALGTVHCSATGTAVEPLRGRDASGWVASAAFGIGAWLEMSAHWSVGLSGRIGLLAPRPIVRVAGRDERFGRPWIEFALGLNYSL